MGPQLLAKLLDRVMDVHVRGTTKSPPSQRPKSGTTRYRRYWDIVGLEVLRSGVSKTVSDKFLMLCAYTALININVSLININALLFNININVPLIDINVSFINLMYNACTLI